MPTPKNNEGLSGIDLFNRVRVLKSEGLTYAEIGAMLGFHSSRAHRILVRSNGPGRGCCESCGEECDELHRHHTNYLTNETINLCQSCHARYNMDTFAVQRARKLKSALEKLKKSLKGMDLICPVEASKISGVPLKFCRELLSSVVEHPLYKQDHPWHLVNWNLPNKILSDAWKIPMKVVGQFRCMYKKGPALWNHKRLNGSSGFEDLIESENKKAKHHITEP